MSGVSTPSRRLSSTTTRVHAAQPAKGLLVQLGPDLRAGSEHQQAHRLAAVAERQHEQPRAAVLAAVRVAHHRAVAVIDLRLLAGRGLDHRAGFRRLAAAQLAHEALDALIAAGEAVVVDQVLPDRHGVAAAGEPQFDGVAMHRARAGRRWRRRFAAGATPESVVTSMAGFAWARSVAVADGDIRLRRMVANSAPKSVVTSMAGFAGRGPVLAASRPRTVSPPTWRPYGDPSLSQIGCRRFPADARGLLNAPQRPSQPPQRDDLLFLFSFKTLLTSTEGNRPHV